MCVWSLEQEDPLEKDMATHSRILAWRITMDGGVWQAAVHNVTKESDTISDYNNKNILYLMSNLRLKKTFFSQILNQLIFDIIF